MHLLLPRQYLDRLHTIKVKPISSGKVQCPAERTCWIGTLVKHGWTRGKDVGRVKLGVHCVCLTCVDHKEDFIIPVGKKKEACKQRVWGEIRYGPFLLIHLLKGISYVVCTDFFVILEFQKLFPTMASHVYEYVWTFIRQKTFGAGNRRVHTTFIKLLLLKRTPHTK